MKESVFEVVFEDGFVIKTNAMNSEQAKILASAERIKRREEYRVKECRYLGPVVG